MIDWISVEDRFPENDSEWGCKVLIYCNDIVSAWVQIIHYDGENWIENEELFPPIVTHWAEITPPNKLDEE